MRKRCVALVLCLLALGALGYIIWRQFNPVVPETAAGYVAAAGTTAPVYDENGTQLGSLVRGAEVQYVAEDAEDGADRVRVVNGEGYAYLDAANLTADYSSAVLTDTVYALRGMSLTDETGAVPGCAVEKGFQGGGDKLRAAGVNLHSLAIIESAEPGHIVFREEA